MAASYNFRSAFNGFNREDVVHYIEYINSKHTAQVNQLRTDLAATQQENAVLKQTPKTNPEQEAQIAELTAKLALLQEQLLSAQAEKADLEAKLGDMTTQRDAALVDQAQARLRNEEELEAYRRAERMERQAKERTESMYQKANSVLTDATDKVDSASAQIAGITDQVTAQLAVLQQAVTGSKIALKDAATSLYAIRMANEE